MDYYISDRIWKTIFDFLRLRKDIHAKNEAKTRLFIEAVAFSLRTSIQWRYLPAHYGKWRAIHRRLVRWIRKGVFDALLKKVQKASLEEVMIDATIVRAHACASGYEKGGNEKHALGRSKGGFSTKIHALVDGLGNPLRFLLTGGQRNDITQAEALIEGVSHATVLADKGYDSNAFIDLLKEKGCEVVIPPRANRKEQRAYDKHIYKERHLIECFFGKIKHYRRIFSRFDKTTAVYTTFLTLASVFIWLR